LTTSDLDLKNQLADLDWGTQAPATTAPQSEAKADAGSNGLSDLDVAVAGVKPKKAKAAPRARRPRVVRGPKAQELVDAVVAGDTVAAHSPPAGRRPRTAQADVLLAAGEGPAIVALFDQMWRDVGSKLARSIGRSKASRQDAAIGWYMLLLAMRERDAK